MERERERDYVMKMKKKKKKKKKGRDTGFRARLREATLALIYPLRKLCERSGPSDRNQANDQMRREKVIDLIIGRWTHVEGTCEQKVCLFLGANGWEEG